MGGRVARPQGVREGHRKGRGLREFFRAPFHYYLLPALLFLIIPGVVASINELSLYDIPLWSWFGLVALAAIAVGLLLVTRWLLLLRGLGRMFTLLIMYATYSVIVSGFVFPVSSHTGMIDPTRAPINTTNVVFSLGVAFGLLIVSESRYRRHLHLGLAVFIAANLAVIAVETALGSSEPRTVEVPRASNSTNLFVISFDGLSGTAMSEALLDPDLRAVLAGFIVFDSVAATSPATNGSMAAELYGNQNFKETAHTTQQLWDYSPSDLVTNVLDANGYQVVTYGAYGTNLNGNGRTIAPTKLVSRSGFMLVNMSLARTLTRAFVPRGWLSEQLGRFLYPPGVPLDENSGFIRRVLAARTPGWHKEYAVSAQDYATWVDQLRAGAEAPTAFFLHFTHTHFPIEYDESCAYRADDEEWYEHNQNYDGAVKQAKCSLRQFGLFLDRIKSLGLLEESMIVLKSDHGQPVSYSQPGSIEASLINSVPGWGLSRYSPFLAIKPLGAVVEVGPSFNGAPVLLDDLARTICEEVDIGYDCLRYPGYNIVEDSSRISPHDEVTMFVMESSESDYRYETHEALAIPRGEGVVKTLYEELSRQGRITPYEP